MEELKKIILDSPEKCNMALPVKTTLYQVYMNGWWITELFGSVAVLVRPRKRKKDGFGLCERKINLAEVTPEAMKFINQTAEEKWDMYKKHMLTYKFGRPTIE